MFRSNKLVYGQNEAQGDIKQAYHVKKGWEFKAKFRFGIRQ
jgi:hypothetical protein